MGNASSVLLLLVGFVIAGTLGVGAFFFDDELLAAVGVDGVDLVHVLNLGCVRRRLIAVLIVAGRLLIDLLLVLFEPLFGLVGCQLAVRRALGQRGRSRLRTGSSLVLHLHLLSFDDARLAPLPLLN